MHQTFQHACEPVGVVGMLQLAAKMALDGCGIDRPHALLHRTASLRDKDPAAAAILGQDFAANQPRLLHAIEQPGEIVLGEKRAHLDFVWTQPALLGAHQLPEHIVQAKRKALIEKFARVEVALGEGPFFAGERFSMVDAVFAPIFRYFDVFDTLAPTGVFAGFAKAAAWRAALAGRPSVREAVSADYAERLKVFLDNHDAWLLKQAA